jgi:hypothetical protein
MEEFPTNSHKAKAAPEENTETAKKIEQVTTGTVVTRKKPLGKRFVETFFGGDTRGVMNYVLVDVLLPAAKDMIADAVSQGIERMIFGEARSTSRRTGIRPGGHSGYVSYNRFAPNPQQRQREEPRNISRRSRASHDFDEIILATRVEAVTVIDRLYDIIARYEQATVSDLYELVGVSGNFTDEKYGWTDLRGSEAVRVRDGYLLSLPKPEQLD